MTIGIYKIVNINNGKIYIGSSKNIEKRFKEHMAKLESNKHHSIKLQRSYNKTIDKSVFVYEIIEIINNVNNLKTREQHYIDLFDAFNVGYNCSGKVDNPQYAMKNIKKANSKVLTTEAYNEFMKIHNHYSHRFIIGRRFLQRLMDVHYKHSTYQTVNELMKWFIENYNNNYHARFTVLSKRIYLAVYRNDTDSGTDYYTLIGEKVIKD